MFSSLLNTQIVQYHINYNLLVSLHGHIAYTTKTEYCETKCLNLKIPILLKTFPYIKNFSFKAHFKCRTKRTSFSFSKINRSLLGLIIFCIFHLMSSMFIFYDIYNQEFWRLCKISCIIYARVKYV